MSGSDLFKGTLDILILRTVSPGPLHGYAIRRTLAAVSGGVLDIEEGALYHALHRLEKQGLLDASWGHSETGRRVKFYQITDQGRADLRVRGNDWRTLARAVHDVLGDS